MNIFKKINSSLGTDGNFEQLSIGRVVDTNDPQQMGRVRAACAYFGDDETTLVENIPWATPISPLAGTTTTTNRGREDNTTIGPVAYGMFNVPKIGTFVLLGCVEGDPKHRIYLGCLHDQFLPHTLPHGRYTYKTNDVLVDEPSGPLSSTENFIQPLYNSQTSAFTKEATQQIVDSTSPAEPRKNFEYRTRAADNGVAGVESEFVSSEDTAFSFEPDDKDLKFTEVDGNEIENTYGYKEDRIQTDVTSDVTGLLYDPQIYSWTTPGFHSVSMSDSPDNCRVRVRSTHGHQIIMDDTNERVYLSTAGGKTWIELDEKGNIDIYGERNISIHAEKDINFTAGDTFRVKAQNGIHLISENEVRVHAKSGNLHLKSGGTTELHSIGDMSMTVANMFLTATTAVHIKASGGVLNLDSSADTNILAGGRIIQTGSQIHHNGPPAAQATATVSGNTLESFYTSRVPEHEPWARVMTNPNITDQDTDNTHTDSAEFPYNSVYVGRLERGFDLERNLKWHR